MVCEPSNLGGDGTDVFQESLVYGWDLSDFVAQTVWVPGASLRLWPCR